MSNVSVFNNIMITLYSTVNVFAAKENLEEEV